MRDEGYYWCKHSGKWIIARWNNTFWKFHLYASNSNFSYYIGDETYFNDNQFEEIDERRIERAEPV